MTNSYDVDHGLSQDEPGPLEPVEIAQQPGAAPATGNTARDQEMYAAGIRTGEENAKHNAAIRAGVPDGWKLLAKKTCYVLMHEGAVIATLAGPESKENAAIIARMLAAPGVSTVEADAVKRLRDAIEGECGGTWISEKQAIAVLAHLGHPAPAPAAGDALDAARYRTWRDQMIENNQLFRQAIAAALPKEVGDTQPPTAAEWDAAIDAAIAAQRKGDA